MTVWKTLAATLVCAGLGLLLWVRGIVPAVSRIDTDFPNYLTAAKIVADGGPTERLYDDAWFQEQISRYATGEPTIGKFGPFPPPTALLLLPLARLQPLNALRVMTGLSLLCMVTSVILLSRLTGRKLAQAGCLVLLSGHATYTVLKFGQPYVLVSLSCILGYLAYRKGWALLAGACFGLFVPIKYFPVVILLYFLFRREWKVVSGGAASAATVVLVSIAVLGWQVHLHFLSAVLGQHLTGHLDMQNPFSASFQSFDSLFLQLFVFDPGSNPHPWLVLPELRVVAVVVAKLLILAVAIASLITLNRQEGPNSVAPSIGLLGILVLLLAPATATYHFILFWLPTALLLDWLLRAGARMHAAALFGLYSLIGFCPYGHTLPFAGRGILTLLAYPRLYLVLAMFITCVHFIRQCAQTSQVAKRHS